MITNIVKICFNLNVCIDYKNDDTKCVFYKMRILNTCRSKANERIKS